MAWTYSDWVTLDNVGNARLARLRLHIQEVSDRITEELSSSGRSISSASLTQYLKDLKSEENQFGSNGPRANGRSRVLRADFKEPQGVD